MHQLVLTPSINMARQSRYIDGIKGGIGGVMGVPQNSKWKTRLVQRGFPDRSFDIEFWQEQGDEAIFSAA
jgi:hypothetical protein